MYEYLPQLLGEKLPEYEGYKSDLHPGISHIFQSAAFRFGHTMIPPGIYRRDEQCNYRMTQAGQPAIRLCTTWWDSDVSILCDYIYAAAACGFVFFFILMSPWLCTYTRLCSIMGMRRESQFVLKSA